MSRHTPGPWKAEFEPYANWVNDGKTALCRITASGKKKTPIYSGPASFNSLRGRSILEAQANAVLMAAAPDLLYALAKLLRRMSAPDPDTSEARRRGFAEAADEASDIVNRIDPGLVGSFSKDAAPRRRQKKTTPSMPRTKP